MSGGDLCPTVEDGLGEKGLGRCMPLHARAWGSHLGLASLLGLVMGLVDRPRKWVSAWALRPEI